MKDRNMGFGIIKRNAHVEQRETVNIPLCGIMTNLIRLRIIFLPSIFLSLPRFAGLVALVNLTACMMLALSIKLPAKNLLAFNVEAVYIAVAEQNLTEVFIDGTVHSNNANRA